MEDREKVKLFLTEGVGGYPLRTVIDNLTDEQILDLVVEYAKSQIKEEIYVITDFDIRDSFPVVAFYSKEKAEEYLRVKEEENKQYMKDNPGTMVMNFFELHKAIKILDAH
jgi:hypothetical protein